MLSPRVSIAGMMTAVLFSAVVFAGLTSESVWWVSAAFTLTLVLLGGATILVFQRRGRPRAFWAGFCGFGWVYFILVFSP